ncbi:MAG TPA: A/G-specific adenine glycosylase [Puia sp.]|nr:A/G-specific adenine glycosylase [Puia sp.]
MNADFSKKLLQWNRKKNKRDMPWKGETDPYKIWLSEIILQQTRVEQGWAYYEKFVKEFPTVHHLAKAPEKKVFKLWEGLGYYNRCKNLIETAKKISRDYKGKFPSTYEEIIELKGIGPYTAAAISSFAFNLPHAVVDGNVERVLSRYFGINTPVDTTDGKKTYTELANALLDKKNPGIYNQSIMDFGAVICKPQNPLCTECPQQNDCQAYQHNFVDMLPVKAKKMQKKERWFYYFIIETDNHTYIHQRKEKDIWQNLYEFVLHESKSQMKDEEIIHSSFIKNILGKEKFTIDKISDAYKQQLTHQTLHVQFVHINISKQISLKDYILIKKKQINKYPFPKSIIAYLSQSAIL